VPLARVFEVAFTSTPATKTYPFTPASKNRSLGTSSRRGPRKGKSHLMVLLPRYNYSGFDLPA